MLDVLARQHRQGRANAHTVVRAQRGAVGPQQIPISQQLDGVTGEVVGRAFILFADHVHVGLKADHRTAFTAARCLLTDEYVAHGIALYLATKPAPLLSHPFGSRRFILGSAGNL